jgi:hypothetical protein
MSKPLEFSSKGIWNMGRSLVINPFIMKALGLLLLAWLFMRYQNPHLDFYWLSGFALCR